MTYLHWVAKTHPGYRPFERQDFSEHFWERLREVFPRAYACVLMPNHFHVITPSVKSDQDLQLKLHQLRCMIGQVSQAFELTPKSWLPVPEPTTIPDGKHLLRQVRYVHLNPCRSHLTREPLSWLWSTHRDYLGLVRDPWSDLKTLSTVSGQGFNAESFHRYVSSDPTAEVRGTPFPKALERKHWVSHVSSVQLKRALRDYYRNESSGISLQAKMMKIDLKRTKPSILQELKISDSTLRRYCMKPEPKNIMAALQYLVADPRLSGELSVNKISS